MYSRIEKFESGWIGLSLEMSESDIQKLIARLNELRNRKIGHFHIRNEDFSADTGMADIEISLSLNEGAGNMTVE